MFANSEDSFQAALERNTPQIGVVSEDNFNFLSKMCLTRMRDVAYGMLEASLRAGATVLVNGSDASDHASDYLERGFRCVLLGEAEWTLLELVQHLLRKGDSDVSHIAGITYLDPGTGERVQTQHRPLIR